MWAIHAHLHTYTNHPSMQLPKVNMKPANKRNSNKNDYTRVFISIHVAMAAAIAEPFAVRAAIPNACVRVSRPSAENVKSHYPSISGMKTKAPHKNSEAD